MIVTVTNVETKSGANDRGGWTVYRATFADGRKASTFNTTIGGLLQKSVGSAVDVELSQTQKGTDIVSAKPAANAPSTSNGSAPAARPSDHNLHIVREVALKAAVEFVRANEQTSTDLVISAAQQFEAYILGEGEVQFDPDAVAPFPA